MVGATDPSKLSRFVEAARAVLDAGPDHDCTVHCTKLLTDLLGDPKLPEEQWMSKLDAVDLGLGLVSLERGRGRVKQWVRLWWGVEVKVAVRL